VWRSWRPIKTCRQELNIEGGYPMHEAVRIWMCIMLAVASVACFFAYIRKKEEKELEFFGKKDLKWLSVALAFLAFLFFLASILIVVPPGHVGVQIVFGKVKKGIFSEGLHLKNPFAVVVTMTTRTQSYTMSKIVKEGERNTRPDAISALTKDNLNVDLDITVLYKLIPEAAPEIYRILGNTKAYTEKIVRPAIRTAIRNSVAKFNASEIMSERRREVEKDIEMELRKMLGDYFSSRNMREAIVIERVLLRNVDPPAKLKTAIQAKLEAEQEAQKMAFILQKEKAEAERKTVEAEGIAEAQKIIARSLSHEYLQWYYIQTLRELIDSPNNSTIILPFDQKLIPLIQPK